MFCLRPPQYFQQVYASRVEGRGQSFTMRQGRFIGCNLWAPTTKSTPIWWTIFVPRPVCLKWSCKCTKIKVFNFSCFINILGRLRILEWVGRIQILFLGPLTPTNFHVTWPRPLLLVILVSFCLLSLIEQSIKNQVFSRKSPKAWTNFHDGYGLTEYPQVVSRWRQQKLFAQAV